MMPIITSSMITTVTTTAMQKFDPLSSVGASAKLKRVKQSSHANHKQAKSKQICQEVQGPMNQIMAKEIKYIMKN